MLGTIYMVGLINIPQEGRIYRTVDLCGVRRIYSAHMWGTKYVGEINLIDGEIHLNVDNLMRHLMVNWKSNDRKQTI